MTTEILEPAVAPKTIDDSYNRINTNARLSREGFDHLWIEIDQNLKKATLKKGSVFEAGDRLFKLDDDIALNMLTNQSNYFKLKSDKTISISNTKGVFNPIKQGYYDSNERVLNTYIFFANQKYYKRRLNLDDYLTPSRTTLFTSTQGATAGTLNQNTSNFDTLIFELKDHYSFEGTNNIEHYYNHHDSNPIWKRLNITQSNNTFSITATERYLTNPHSDTLIYNNRTIALPEKYKIKKIIGVKNDV